MVTRYTIMSYVMRLRGLDLFIRRQVCRYLRAKSMSATLVQAFRRSLPHGTAAGGAGRATPGRAQARWGRPGAAGRRRGFRGASAPDRRSRGGTDCA